MNLFLQKLAEWNKGQLASKLSDELTRGVAAIRHKGGKAKLTLEITIQKLSEETIGIIPSEPKLKLPSYPMHANVYFANDNGELSKQSFEQRELPLAIAPVAEETEAKEAS